MQIKSLKTLEDVETLFQNNEEYEIRNLDLSNIDLSSLPIYE